MADWPGPDRRTIEAFKIGEQVRDGKTFAVFPYLREGELVEREVSRHRRQARHASGGRRRTCLFGWHLIDQRLDPSRSPRGEIDAMTLHRAGIQALSVNAGAGNHQWIESDWERLDRFSEIFVCFDADEAGKKGAKEVIQRLGVDRCKLVKFGARTLISGFKTELMARTSMPH